MKFLMIVAALLAAPAFAQSDASSQSGSQAVVAPSNIGNPVINMPANNPYTRTDVHTNQAATGPSVFVNPPASDTCDRAGFGVSVGAVGGNFGANIPRGMSAKCDMRADSINLKVTGAPQAVITARQCMDADMSEAFARAGMPCIDARQNKPQSLALLP